MNITYRTKPKREAGKEKIVTVCSILWSISGPCQKKIGPCRRAKVGRTAFNTLTFAMISTR